VQIDAVGDDVLHEMQCEGPIADEIVVGRQQLKTLETEIDNLSDRMRNVFILRRIQGLPQRDTAEVLRMSESSVEKLSKVAIDRLAEKCGRRTEAEFAIP